MNTATCTQCGAVMPYAVDSGTPEQKIIGERLAYILGKYWLPEYFCDGGCAAGQ